MRSWCVALAFVVVFSGRTVAQPPPAGDSDPSQEIEELIQQLGSPQYQNREEAHKRLIKIGSRAEPDLRRARSSKDSEIASRAKAALRSIAEAKLKRAEVHVVGLYCSRAEKAVVEVTPTDRPLILVLCAYESVTWDLQIPPETQVVRVILSGYHPQDITDIGVPVESLSYDEGALGYFYAYNNDEERFPQMVRRVHEMTGKVPKTFQGRYEFVAKPLLVPFKITLE